LNLTGGILSVLTLTNMKPVGDPIKTGENKFMKVSGAVTRPDTLKADIMEGEQFLISISHRDSLLIKEREIGLNGTSVEIELQSIFNSYHVSGLNPGDLQIYVVHLETNYSFTVPLDEFMKPFAVVENQIAQLRSTPEFSDLNIFTELAEGSALPLLESEDQNWHRVRFGGTDTYLHTDATRIEWRFASDEPGADVVALGDIPFGDIDVENAIPVLKQRNPGDRAIVLSNHRDNQLGNRQWVNRDILLFESYMINGFSMNPNQVMEFESKRSEIIYDRIDRMKFDSLNTVWTYITGFGKIEEENDKKIVNLVHRDPQNRESIFNLNLYLKELASLEQKRMIVLIDLEFISDRNENSLRSDTDALENLANDVLNIQPMSVIIFSSRPNQTSALFAGRAGDNKRHHVFTYYWAEALQQRKTNVFDLISHIQNNVDYTARRLIDRPQEVQVFGNLDFNLTE
ncbi:MAG: hypothetical protein ACFCU6_09055, partial [Balneolaceae bacterium]